MKVYRCSHGRQKSQCRDCGGGSFCAHDRIRTHCRDCKGSSTCEHSTNRSVCKICVGGHICPHGKPKSDCSRCGGSRFCKHNRHRSYCKKCLGNRTCEHYADKARCRICGGFVAWANHLVSAARKRAKTRNLPFDLTREWAIEQLKAGCPVFRFQFEFEQRYGSKTATIDKFNPALGYVMSNCYVISMLANRIKTSATSDQVSRVAEWMKGIEDVN